MNHKFDENTKSAAQPLTRRAALKTIGLGLAGLALMRFGESRTQAITLGTLDGDAHPNVGAGVFLKSLWPPIPAPLATGSGTLIHPRVMLTAGHATYFLETAIAAGAFSLSDFRLSFASNALDPGSWRTVSGVVTHPDFYAAAQAEPGLGAVPVPDVGVVILRDPVAGILPAPLPSPGFLDALQAAGTLRSGPDRSKFTVVGYGTQLGDPVGELPFPPDGLRRFVQSEFLNLHDRWLFLNQNFAQGVGGGGFGDSGGPIFWVDPATGENTIVAITSRGDGRCVATGVCYRLDTEEALIFLQTVIAMVDAREL